MTRVAAQRATFGLAVLAAALAAGCAAKSVPDAVPGIAVTFPDFLFPTVPDQFLTDPVVATHERGWRLLQAGDVRNAERAFGDALKQNTGFFPAHAGVGYVKVASGALDDAVERFDRALAQAPQYVPAMVGRGEALLGLNRLDEARQAFAGALALDPSLGSLQRRVDVLQLRLVQEHIATARGAAQAGRPAEAREAYRKAIAASPDSAFLHRELALVEQKAGALDAAFAHGTRALELEPGDTRVMLLLADVHEARGDLEAAEAMLAKVQSLEPSDALVARLKAVRDRAAVTRLPAEYRAIASVPAISRGELAALIGVRLQPILQSARPGNAVVMTDTRGHWAAAWILAVARAGLMEPFANHTFQPAATITRGDLARIAARALNLVGARNPAVTTALQNARETFADLPATHLNYPAASRAVAAGVMSKLDGETFQLNKPVSGAEAIQAVDRLDALATSGPR